MMVHLYLCLPDRCGQKYIRVKETDSVKLDKKKAFLFCSYLFSVRTGQAEI